MRALWSDRPNCSHSVSQKVKRIRRFSEFGENFGESFGNFVLNVASFFSETSFRRSAVLTFLQ